MSEAIIKVENLGKKYRIQHQAERQRYTALRDVIAQKCTAPFRALFQRGALSPPRSGRGQGEVSNGPAVPSSRGPVVASTEDFWALRDVSFEVKRGEVVGIIGPPRAIDFHQPTHWTGTCTRFVCRAGPNRID